MAKVGWLCLALVGFLALQASGNPSTNTEESLIHDLNEALDDQVQEVQQVLSSPLEELEDGRHKLKGSKSKNNNGNIIANLLASYFEYLYAYCKRKISASGVTLTKIGGGYYYFYTAPALPRLNWFDARDWCASRGMALASIETAAENTLITSRINTLLATENGDTVFLWLSGNRGTTTGAFRWGSGNIFDFTNWELGQPTTDLCVTYLKRNGNNLWDDRPCTDLGRFVCEVTNPCSDILNMAKRLKSTGSRSSSNSYNANILHRRHSSSSDRSASDKVNMFANAVDKVENHIKDKLDMIGSLGNNIADKLNIFGNKKPLLEIIKLSKNSKSSRSSRDSSRSSRDSSRSSSRSSRSSRSNSNSLSGIASISVPSASSLNGISSSVSVSSNSDSSDRAPWDVSGSSGSLSL